MWRHYLRRQQEARQQDSNDRERLPVSIETHCLGEQCVHYAGIECDSRLDLLSADGTSAGLDVPPYIGESSYEMRGHVCTGGTQDELVRLETKVLKPGVSYAKLIALSGCFGDLPHQISTSESTLNVSTFLKSND